jgi:hypothetical protein
MIGGTDFEDPEWLGKLLLRNAKAIMWMVVGVTALAFLSTLLIWL